MTTPLVHIDIISCYRVQGERVLLPERLAKCTPDAHRAVNAIKDRLAEMGGQLVLSDMFRTFEMQLQAHLDFESGKKLAFSPPPGGSLHESGRAFDLQLIDLRIPLKGFWDIAREFGFLPIIKKPDDSASEAWHFDHAGSHRLVEEYARDHNVFNPYGEMAASAILSEGIRVQKFLNRQAEANIQYGLVRLGHELGLIDGFIGTKTNAALVEAGIDPSGTKEEILAAVELQLRDKFPEEYQTDSLTLVETQ